MSTRSMRSTARLMHALAVCVLCGGLAGCEDPRDVTMHAPGEYSGKTDPLLALEATPEYEKQLEKRFDYQRDR